MSQNADLPDVMVKTKSKPEDETKTRRIPPYNVILHNDNFHSFDFVVEVLRKALGYTQERAWKLTMQAHHAGRSVVWTGSKEVAELKIDQIRTFHEVRIVDQLSLGPLDCIIEPAPGG